MPITVLDAMERKPGKFREAGFVPGVIYGDNITGASPVKFDAAVLRKVIVTHGANAKVDVDYNNSVKSGFIKEVQRNAISKQITHVDIQIVSPDHEIKMQIPILYENEEILSERNLQVQVYRNTIGVSGTMDMMPDAVRVDVSGMKLDDTVAVGDMGLNPQLKITDNEDTVYGAIVNLPSQLIGGEEQPLEEKPTEETHGD